MASLASSGRVSLWRRIMMGACALAAVGVATVSPAEAHHFWRHRVYHRHFVAAAAPTYAGPPFAAVVVDANDGRTLYSVNPNELRHPASITKVMTLYLLFEKLQNGSLSLDSRLTVSQNAANQQPSKLGIAPGETISVDDAIKAIVTRSANDIAVTIAENLGGSESAFAAEMTEKAHELGMTRTLYRNASGLPNPEQLTTAHDLAVLAQAIQEKFPQYFHYFSTHEFDYAGEVIGNHDHLLGRVDGVDGIKTGYTNASGFNLMTSMHKDGRSLVGIVLGGRTAGSRDRIMEGILAQNFALASSGQRTTSVFAQAAQPETSAPALALVSAANGANDDGDITASAPVLPRAHAANATAARLAAAAKPVQVASAAPSAPVEQLAPVKLGRAAAKAKPVIEQGDASDDDSDDDAPQAKAHAPAIPAARPAAAPTKVADKAPVQKPDQEAAKATAASHDGYLIQIGATDDQSKAKSLLSRAMAQNKGLLASAKPLTEKVQKGDDTFYRARFAMDDSARADAACKSLKRTGFSCIAVHD